MSEQATPAQVQTAPVEQTTNQAPVEQTQLPSEAEVIRQLGQERIAGSDPREIKRLEGLLSTLATSSTDRVPPEEPKVEQQQQQHVEAAPVEQQRTEEKPPGEKPAEELSERWRFKNPEDRKIAALAHELEIPLAEAAKLYESTKPKPVVVQQEQPKPDPTIVKIEADIETVAAQIKAIRDDDPLDSRLDELVERRTSLKVDLSALKTKATMLAELDAKAASQDIAKQQKAFNDACAVSEQARALKYPELKDPNSAMSLAVKGLTEQMKDPNHPNHKKMWESDVPLFIADDIAAKLGKVPATVNAPQQQQQREEVVRPVAGSRTSAVASTEPTADEIVAAKYSQLEKALAGGSSGKNFDSADGVMIL